MSTEQLLTLMDVADTVQLSPHTIRKLVRQGKLHPVQICRRLLFNRADVERLIREGSRPALERGQ